MGQAFVTELPAIATRADTYRRALSTPPVRLGSRPLGYP
jgi:hypothetical protein